MLHCGIRSGLANLRAAAVVSGGSARSAWADLPGVVIGDQCYVFAEELEWRRGRRPCALFVPRHRPF